LRTYVHYLERDACIEAIWILPLVKPAASSPKTLLPFSLAGVDLELSRDFPVQTALNEHVEQIKRISGADEDEYNDTDDHTAPQGSSPV
jgi:hypothetical protein